MQRLLAIAGLPLKAAFRFRLVLVLVAAQPDMKAESNRQRVKSSSPPFIILHTVYCILYSSDPGARTGGTGIIC